MNVLGVAARGAEMPLNKLGPPRGLGVEARGAELPLNKPNAPRGLGVAARGTEMPLNKPGAPRGLGAARRNLRKSLRKPVAVLLLAGALLAGCARSAPTQAAPAACGSAAPNAMTVDTAVREGRAEPEPRRVKIPVGSPVLLGVTSDVAGEVHVHGYDLVYPVQPGTPACVLFVADRTGVFDVEAHPETLLLQLEVR